MDIPGDLERYDYGRVRNGQVELGPSNVGTCLRRSGFKHHGVPPSDPRAKGQARLGTLLHLGWTRVIEALDDPQRVPDVPVIVPGLKAPGHADDVDYARRIVDDLKSKSARAWERWVTFGVDDEAWDQAELYAYGLLCAEQAPDAPSDLPPWTLSITALNRETGEEAVFERPADPARGERLAERMVDRQEWLDASRDPGDLPQEGAGPGRGFPCDWCEWVTACWGPSDGDLSPQAKTVVGDPDAIEALGLDYLRANEVLGDWKGRQADARAYLQGIPGGDYGAVRLRWQGGRDLDPEPDLVEMVKRLQEWGEPIPMKAKKSARSLRVLRVPPPDVD